MLFSKLLQHISQVARRLIHPTVGPQDLPGTSLGSNLTPPPLKGYAAPGYCELACLVFFFFTLVTGPRRSLSLKLSDTRACLVAVNYHPSSGEGVIFDPPAGRRPYGRSV